MQIEKISSTEDLKFTFKVIFQNDDVKNRVKDWILKKSETVSLPGFRKGKVPLKTIELMYLRQALESTVNYCIEKACEKIISEHKIKPANPPKFKTLKTYDHDSNDDEALIFEIEILGLPDVIVDDFSKIEIENLKVIVTEEDIDNSIKKIASEKTFLVEKDSEIEQSDIAVLSIKTTHNKKIIKDFSVKEIPLPFLDQNYKKIDDTFGFIDSVVSVCIGKKKDDVITTEHTFSEKYKNKDWASKKVDIEIKILKVRSNKKLDSSEDIAIASGFKNVQELRDFVKQDLEKHYSGIVKIYKKRKLLDALSGKYLSLEVPKDLIDHEFENIWSKLLEEVKDTGFDEGVSEEDAKKEYYDIAARRVRLGLVITQYAKDFSIFVTQDMLKNAVANEMNRDPTNKEKILHFYQNNRGAVEYLKSSILEELVVDDMFKKITSVDVSVTIKELRSLMKDILPGFDGDEDASNEALQDNETKDEKNQNNDIDVINK